MTPSEGRTSRTVTDDELRTEAPSTYRGKALVDTWRHCFLNGFDTKQSNVIIIVSNIVQ